MPLVVYDTNTRHSGCNKVYILFPHEIVDSSRWRWDKLACLKLVHLENLLFELAQKKNNATSASFRPIQIRPIKTMPQVQL